MKENDKNDVILEKFDEGENEGTRKKKNGTNLYKIILNIIRLVMLILLVYLAFFKEKGTKVQKVATDPFITTPIIISDIGGTNCRLKLLRISSDITISPKEIKGGVFKPWEFDSIETLISKFLKPYRGTDDYPIFGVIGIPGAVVDNTMLELVNIPNWKRTNGDQLAKNLGLDKLVFLNDFVCNGYGIQANLKEGVDYVNINKKPIKKNEKKFIIGPGTGLGVCYLIKNKGDKFHRIYASEGSHQDFAPKNEESFKYLQFLQKYYNIENISCEKACAGPALIPLYQFLHGLYPEISRDQELGKEIDKINKDSPKDLINDLNKKLVTYGVTGKCELSIKVLEFIIQLMGNISGNMSIYTLPYGGVYIVGSLATNLENILKDMDENIFLQYYLSRGEQNNLLKEIPIILVKNPDIGLLGAIECARRMTIGINP